MNNSTVVVDVVLQHLILEDATELRQGLQVDNVDDEWPQDVVKRQTQLLQQLTRGGKTRRQAPLFPFTCQTSEHKALVS